MGVMECCRCDNVMCDHLLFGHVFLSWSNSVQHSSHK